MDDFIEEKSGEKFTFVLFDTLLTEYVKNKENKNIVHTLKKIAQTLELDAYELYDLIYKNVDLFYYELLENDPEFYNEVITFDYKKGFSNDYIKKLETIVESSIVKVTANSEFVCDTIVI